jgi:hypothetical protein
MFYKSAFRKNKSRAWSAALQHPAAYLGVGDDATGNFG